MNKKYTDEEIKFILTLNENEIHFIKELNDKLPDLRYIGGYINSDEKVILQCKKCGDIFKRSASIIRTPHYIKFKCIECNKRETQKKTQERLFTKRINSYLNKLIRDYYNGIKKQYKELYNYFKKNTLYISKCKYCNEDILSNNKRKIVCDKCCKKYKLKCHSNKSLKDLYIRDKGICHICNKKCDYNDYIVRGKTIICGNNYPSIDHIIPLSKGGTDEWNNIKLAHRWCNSVKRDSTAY